MKQENTVRKLQLQLQKLIKLNIIAFLKTYGRCKYFLNKSQRFSN